MPDESCRTCGGELEEYLKCNECRKINQYMCCKCTRKTLLQYHFLCNVGKQDPLLESIRNNLPIIKLALTS